MGGYGVESGLSASGTGSVSHSWALCEGNRAPLNLPLRIHFNSRSWKIGICKSPDRNIYNAGSHLDIIKDYCAAFCAKMKSVGTPAISGARPAFPVASNSYLFCCEARVMRKGASGSALARQAMADGYPNRLALNRCSELTAIAGGFALFHGRSLSG
jgi:hypothetical protein